MADSKLPRPKDNEAGVFGATLTAVNVTSIAVTPVPGKAPGIIVAEPGTVKEEHIFYRKRDAGAGTITGLIRDITNLNGGVGQEHTSGEDWETLQAARYVENMVDALQDGYQEEMQVVARVDNDTFTADTNRAAYYTRGRFLRFNYDDTKIAIVLSSAYNAGTGLTTVEVIHGLVPATLTNVEIGNQQKALTQLIPTFYTTDTGAANAHVVALSPAIGAYYTGLKIAYKAAIANTGAVTVNVDTIGAKTIKKNNDNDLASGDIEAGQWIILIYDGTYFQLVTPPASTASGDGWNADANTWTYSSVDGATGVLTINADLTGVIQAGDRIKLTQTTAKYFLVTATPTFAAGATTLTIWGGTDYTLANAVITLPYYSHQRNPFGFNSNPTKWQVEVKDPTLRTQGAPVTGTWYNLGTTNCQITIPPGLWNVEYEVCLEVDRASGNAEARVTLSTANNTESDIDMTNYITQNASVEIQISVYRRKTFSLAAKTLHYLNAQAPVASTGGLGFYGSQSTTIIRAISAYL